MIPADEEKVMHLSMMRNPDRWPNWPRLPLKRHNEKNWLDCGLLIDFNPLSEQDPVISPIVYVANMFENVTERTPKEEYETMEDLYEAGWRVD